MLGVMELATWRLQLRDLQADDLAAMIELWTDGNVGRFMGSCGPRSAEETARWLRETIEYNRASPRASHNAAIIVAATGERAGWIGCGESSEPVGEWAFGYALRPGCRGHGYAREALVAVLGFCLGEVGVSSVWGECDVSNHRSEGVMRAAGMLPAGASATGDPRFRADRSWRPPATGPPRARQAQLDSASCGHRGQYPPWPR